MAEIASVRAIELPEDAPPLVLKNLEDKLEASRRVDYVMRNYKVVCYRRSFSRQKTNEEDTNWRPRARRT